MKLSLYNIQSEYLEIAQQLIDNGGEVTPELETALAITEQNLQTKGVNYGFVIKQMEGEIDIIDSEIKRLSALKKSRSNSIDRLKKSISEAMIMFGIEEIKIPTLKLNFRKSESVEITSEVLVDGKFKTMHTTISVDKMAIKEAIKAGEEVTGAQINVNKNLQIK